MYQVCVQGRGQTETRCFDRKVDAHRWGLETENVLHGSPNHDMSFKRLAELWFENHCLIRKAPASIRGDRQKLKPIVAMLGGLPVRELSARDIDRLVAHLKTLGKKSNKTINDHVLLAQTVLNYGVRLKF